MKIKEVPQDNNSSMKGETKVIYAKAETGKLESTETTGWDVEAIVLDQALDEIKRLANDAYARAAAGKTSPLEYHMYNQRMDLPMLAQAMGRFKWMVKRDFNPQRFQNISPEKLKRYAHVMGIEVDKLKTLPETHD